MSQDLSNRIIDLSPIERQRLAAWLTQLDPVRGINRGRWVQLADGSTEYISHRELSTLMDVAPPYGMALDIIRGHAVVKASVFDLTQEVPMP